MSVELVHRSRPAMGTWFEARLVGHDAEHLEAVAEAILDEVERIERLLSRFDPRSEISRINRQGHVGDVLVDYELLHLLLACRRYQEQTGGWFDITATSRALAGELSPLPAVPLAHGFQIDRSRRTVRLTRAGAWLDLGGIGKGYALDRAAELLARNNVARAMLHGGTSSLLARGLGPDDQPWMAALRDPCSPPETAAVLEEVPLADHALSASAALAPGDNVSDIVDPLSGRPLAEQAACAVVAPSATQAEALSTALVLMGKSAAAAYTESRRRDELAVAWIEPAGTAKRVTWFGRP